MTSRATFAEAPRRPAPFLVATVAAGVLLGWLALLPGAPVLPGGLPLGSLALVLLPGAVATLLLRRDAGLGLREVLRSAAGLRRVGAWGWAMAAGVPVVSVAVGALLAAAAGGLAPGPPPSVTRALGALVVFALAAVPEELGWSSYATHGLLRRHRVATTGLLVGTAWSLFHLPSWAAMGYSWAWIGGQVAYDLALRSFIVGLYRDRGRSLALACLVHAVANTATLYPAGWAGVNPVLHAGPLAMLTAAMLARTSRSPAAARDPSRRG